MDKKCLYCGKTYKVWNYEKDIRKYCSMDCVIKSRKGKLIGKNNPNWCGGKSIISCEMCSKLFKVNPGRKDIARFCSMKCEGKYLSILFKGSKHPQWKGGKIKTREGYIGIWKENCLSRSYGHPYIFEHRLVVENYIGRLLSPKERVHHINEDKTDNSPENLYLFSSHKEHFLFHKKPYKLTSNII